MDVFAAAPLGSLTGLRALANAAIVTVHAVFLYAHAIGTEEWYKVLETEWLARAALSAPLLIALNIFFALTALLAAVYLVPQLQSCHTARQTREVILRYWARRFWRLAPAFYVAVLLHAGIWLWEDATAHKSGSEEAHELSLNLYREPATLRWIWTEFFFLSNLLPSFWTIPWGWNLKVQADFYLGLPLLLVALKPRVPGFRHRLAIACGFMYFAAILQRIAAVLLLDIGSPISVLAFGNRGKSGGHSAEALRTYEAFQAWVWTSGIGRLADLSSGLLIYLWISRPGAQARAVKRRQLYQAAALLAAMVVVSTMSFPIVPQAAEPNGSLSMAAKVAAVLLPLSVVAPLIVFVSMLYLILQPDDCSKRLSAMLASRAWHPFADRSYAIYLLHVDVYFLLFKVASLSSLLSSMHPKSKFMTLPLVLYFASYAAAAMLDGLLRTLGL